MGRGENSRGKDGTKGKRREERRRRIEGNGCHDTGRKESREVEKRG